MTLSNNIYSNLNPVLWRDILIKEKRDQTCRIVLQFIDKQLDVFIRCTQRNLNRICDILRLQLHSYDDRDIWIRCQKSGILWVSFVFLLILRIESINATWMKIAALLSGGKDSCYNMLECVKRGHEIVCLVNLLPGFYLYWLVNYIENQSVNELDSFMYQTIGHTAIDVFLVE